MDAVKGIMCIYRIVSFIFRKTGYSRVVSLESEGSALSQAADNEPALCNI